MKLVPVSLPQSAGNASQGTIETENIKESQDLPESEQNGNSSRTNSRRPTRSKLWDNPEEDLPLLDSPLEVDSETPVADALIKRLQDEEKQEGTYRASAFGLKLELWLMEIREKGIDMFC